MPSPADYVEPSTTRIPVRSRRQAMEWSLVLVSQGIETTIQPPGEKPDWALVIAFRDSERALKSLKLYRVENRGWPWQQQWAGHEFRFDWGSLVWVAWMIILYGLSAVMTGFKEGGILDSAQVFSGQWWRIFTAISLHADLGHLATNLAIGLVLLGLAMGRYGTGTGLLAAYLTGAGGNILSLLLNAKPFHGLGASGMIMGALGLLAAQSLARSGPGNPSLKQLLVGVVAGLMLFVLFGLTPGTDIAAHLGGFLAGLVLGAILVLLPAGFLENRKLNLANGALLAALTLLTWGMALRR